MIIWTHEKSMAMLYGFKNGPSNCIGNILLRICWSEFSFHLVFRTLGFLHSSVLVWNILKFYLNQQLLVLLLTLKKKWGSLVPLQELIQVIENGTACQIGFCVWSKIGHWIFMCHWGKFLKLIVFGSQWSRPEIEWLEVRRIIGLNY